MSATAAVRLGFVPLNDSAALLVARALGLFETEGLSVNLVREASWATVRDKLAAGVLEGAHILAPLALAVAAGIGCEATPLVAPFALNFGGAAITLRSNLADLAQVGGLGAVVRARRAAGGGVLTFASVFPFSIHDYCLRTWVAASGLDPDIDVRLTVAPPSRAADLLAEGVIDGFCAGEPWNAVAVSRGAGRIVARSESVLPRTGDKLLALDAAWAADADDRVPALVRVLDRASAWIADPGNLAVLSDILARPDGVGVDAQTVAAGLRGMVFHGDGANRPDPAHARWLWGQMRRWGQVAAEAETGPRVYRPDLYDRALDAGTA